MHSYKRGVNYYETDAMGIVHHTNYIRYFEEARLDLMHKTGYPYRSLEEMGLIIPVVDVYCKYIYSLKFEDEFEVRIKFTKFSGVKMEFEYEIYRTDDMTLCVTGCTSHCFVDCEHKPISIKRTHPELFDKMASYVEK